MSIELIITAIVAVILIVGAVVGFWKGKGNIKRWLFYAVTEAEKALGSNTGKLKLAQVFANFLGVFPFLSKFVSFATFSKWVDIALEEMRKYLKSNQNANDYVGVEQKDTKAGE